MRAHLRRPGSAAAVLLWSSSCATASVDPIADAGAGGSGAAATGVEASAPVVMDAAARDVLALKDARASHPLQGADPYPPVRHPPENPHSPAKAMLGKILFWDEQLSADDTVACGTCHRPEAGGSDPRAATPEARLPGPDGRLDEPTTLDSDDIRGALGIIRCDSGGNAIGSTIQVTPRKPPSYLDAMHAPALFWDGRAGGELVDPETGAMLIATGGALESQALEPPLSPVEMACEGRTWPDVVERLRGVVPLALAHEVPEDMADFIADHGTSYPSLFAAAFAEASARDPEDISAWRIAFALADHERQLTSDRTPWDRWNAGDDAALTPAQVRGFEIFMGKAKCDSCHPPPLFTDDRFHFIGFHDPGWDEGRASVTGEAHDAGKMKTPTLRNVGLREPGGLLHRGDGPGRDLETVLRLYADGGRRDIEQIVATIDPLIEVLDLTEDDMADLASFLRQGLTDPRAAAAPPAPPFDRPLLASER